MAMSNEQTKRSSWEHLLFRAVEAISLSEAQYTQIDDRYSQLQKILSASDNPLLAEAHIFVQGSMRLKTTIKPVSGAPKGLDTVDADAIVWLPHAKNSEADEILEAIEVCFRSGSRVQSDLEQLRRGVRITYADENPGFHIDITPARATQGNIEDNGEGKLEVPDRVTGWKASSPIPYSNWLQAVSKETIALEHLNEARKALGSIDAATQSPLPEYQDYIDQDPLRATIKLLKRHRDEWAIRTGNKEHRPISAVITTLATHAYLEVVKESQSSPIQPLDAILEIVRRMPNHISRIGGQYQVCNPTDAGENFAEKWNRTKEGHLYQQAFTKWHSDANSSISLGLESFESAEAFNHKVKERFGISASLITEANNEVPANWTLAGRKAGVTRNALAMGTVFGANTSSADDQKEVKPVERLG